MSSHIAQNSRSQTYVHIGGKNYGPYTVDQLRAYVKAGNLREYQPACHDGKNWVSIREVPGYFVKPKFQPVKSKHQPVKPTAKEKEKPVKKKRWKFLLVIVFIILLLGSIGGAAIFWNASKEIPDLSGQVFTITSDQVVEVYDGDTFKINLPTQHPIFGNELSIRLAGVDTPEMKGTSDQVKALAVQAREVAENALKGADKIELRNPQRGKFFRVVAEVWIDGESLADILKAKELAKDYDGVGPRPVW